MKFEKNLTKKYDYLALDGSEIRLLPPMKDEGLCHYTLSPGGVSKAVKHQTVEEIWYFIQSQGKVWCKQGEQEEVVAVKSGLSLIRWLRPVFQPSMLNSTARRENMSSLGFYWQTPAKILKRVLW